MIPLGVRVSLVLLLVLPVAARAQSLADPELEVETVVGGLSFPVAMGFLAPGDFLVLEKNSGQVRRVLDGVLLTEPVLDLDVATASERGLLGIAVNTENPPRVFLYLTEADVQGGTPLGNRVYRYDWNPQQGILENPLLLLDLPVLPGPNHDGGSLVLGPPGEGPAVGDGAFLYVVIGDLNRNGQLENFPQGDAPDDTAVVLRILQDGSPAPGNPFQPYCSGTVSVGCGDDLDCPMGELCLTQVARYWAYGVRNSFGTALDPVTGLLWDTENGPESYDEINALPAGTNSGWEAIMGPDARDAQGVADLWDVPGAGPSYRDPEFSWLTTVAPTGIVLPHGSALGPAYDDVVLVGNFNLGQVIALPLNATRTGLDLGSFPGLEDRVADTAGERDQLLFGSGFGGSFQGVSDLEIGPDGALYVVSIGSGSTGTVYRVRRPGTVVPPTGPIGLSLVVAPNPLRVGAEIFFRATQGRTARIEIYDLRGRQVAVLHEGTASGAIQQVAYDAELAAGVYVLRLEDGQEEITRKVAVLE